MGKFVPILLLAILGAAAGFFKVSADGDGDRILRAIFSHVINLDSTLVSIIQAAVPHQETAVIKAATAASSTLSALFDDGLDNPEIVSDMNISPARKCGFCMGVSECPSFARFGSIIPCHCQHIYYSPREYLSPDVILQ